MYVTWNYGVCRAPGLPQPPQSEADASTVAEVKCKGGDECESELDLDEINIKLELIKQSIVKLRSQVVYTPPNPCVDEAALQVQDEDFSTNQERLMMALHRSNCALKCQLQEVIKQFYATRQRIKLYEKKRCQLNEHIIKMRKDMSMLNEFSTSVKLKLGLCIERFEQIKTSKVDNDAFRKMMIKNQRLEEAMTYCLVPKQCHAITRRSLAWEITSLRSFLHSLYEMLRCHFTYFERISKIIAEKNKLVS